VKILLEPNNLTLISVFSFIESISSSDNSIAVVFAATSFQVNPHQGYIELEHY